MEIGEKEFKMRLEIGEGEKDEYISFLLRQYRLVDALWFLSVEDEFGLDAAVRLNEGVWQEMAVRSAKEIKRRFGIHQKGIDGFLKALSYFPWSVIIGYEVERRDGAVIIRVPYCPPQEARIRGGKAEFPCKRMHEQEFKLFAKEIDEGIRVRCIFAPPDEHPRNVWCEWEFSMRD
jgi:hypothetical protein